MIFTINRKTQDIREDLHIANEQTLVFQCSQYTLGFYFVMQQSVKLQHGAFAPHRNASDFKLSMTTLLQCRTAQG